MNSCKCDYGLSWYKDMTCMFDQSHNVSLPCFGDWNNISEIWSPTCRIFMFFIPSVSRAAPSARLNNFFLPGLRSFSAAVRCWLTATQLPQIDIDFDVQAQYQHYLCTSLKKKRKNTFRCLWFSTTDKVSQEGAVCCFVRGSADLPLDSLKQTLKCPHTQSHAAEQPGDCVN